MKRLPPRSRLIKEKNMLKKMATLGMFLLLSCLASKAIAAGQPGTTQMVFNKKLVYKMQPMMPYEQPDQNHRRSGQEGRKGPGFSNARDRLSLGWRT